MATEAESWTRRYGKGQWRTARKEHGCDRFFEKHVCHGDGLIHRGDRYFDTEELRSWTKGPNFYRACAACANHIDADALPDPSPSFAGRFSDAAYVDGFSA